jgi:hypothetical protein
MRNDVKSATRIYAGSMQRPERRAAMADCPP